MLRYCSGGVNVSVVLDVKKYDAAVISTRTDVCMQSFAALKLEELKRCTERYRHFKGWYTVSWSLSVKPLGLSAIARYQPRAFRLVMPEENKKELWSSALVYVKPTDAYWGIRNLWIKCDIWDLEKAIREPCLLLVISSLIWIEMINPCILTY